MLCCVSNKKRMAKQRTQFLRPLTYIESTTPVFRNCEYCFCSRVISGDGVIISQTDSSVQLHQLFDIVIYYCLKAIYRIRSLSTIPCSPLMIEVISIDLTGACSLFLASALSSLDPVSGDVLVWKGGFDKRRNLQFLGEYFSSFSLSVLFYVKEKIQNSSHLSIHLNTDYN